jgi:hypothetical protein
MDKLHSSGAISGSSKKIKKMKGVFAEAWTLEQFKMDIIKTGSTIEETVIPLNNEE